jgi:hypothetical protein
VLPLRDEMSFLLMETGVLLVVILIAWEMHRQQVSWPRVVVRSVLMFAGLTVLIAFWRGL